MRRIYEGLGLGGDLTFLELAPDGFDHVRVGAERFDIPKHKEVYADRLAQRFPREARGVRRYLDTVGRIAAELDSIQNVEGLRDVLALPFRAPNLARWGLASARSLIDSHVENPLLRAILAAQSGDHGLPPSRAPAAVHATVTAHYFNGGYYPRGGAYTIPRAFIRALRRAGGEIKVRAEVSRILIEDGRAIGVRLGDGTEIRARRVVSNADPRVTFGRLVGAEHLSRGLKRKLDRTRWSTSALSLFLATDLDVRGAGLDSGNYWYYQTPDVEGIYQDFADKDSLIREMSAKDARQLITDGHVDRGMIPKVEACVIALAGGVGRTHIIDGRRLHALLIEVFTDEGVGTMIR